MHNIDVQILKATLYKNDWIMEVTYKLNNNKNDIAFIIKDGKLKVVADANYFNLSKELDYKIVMTIVDKAIEFNKTNDVEIKNTKYILEV